MLDVSTHGNAEQVIRYYLSFMPPRGCESILDIGAGMSVPYKGVLQTRCKKYASCDIRPSDKIDYNIDLTEGTLFKNKQWDWGWCIETMEHIPQELQKKAFEEVLRVCKNVVFTFPTPKHWTFHGDPGHVEVIIKPEDYKSKFNFIDKSTLSGRNIWIFTNKKLKTEVKKGSIIQEGYNPKFYRLCKKTNMEKNKKFFSKFDVIEDFEKPKIKSNKFFKS